jgi:hypothetical protein
MNRQQVPNEDPYHYAHASHDPGETPLCAHDFSQFQEGLHALLSSLARVEVVHQ